MREKLLVGQYYHVFSRGVNRQPLFRDDQDFQRFYESLYLFNDINYKRPGGGRDEDREIRLATWKLYESERKPYVKIISFAFIPNHFHLFIQPLQEDGAPKFLHKLNKGFARYHNLRHGRSGHVFEGTYKSVHIIKEAHFFHIPRYIHLNALDLTHPNWREGTIADWPSAKQQLDAYPWTSHHVYMGKEQPLPVIDETAAREFFPTIEEYEKYLRDWSGRYVFEPEFRY